jgi:ectoine hydroxylase-related dioxygenase (phytanoyl-CoA dioxygenase family)
MYRTRIWMSRLPYDTLCVAMGKCKRNRGPHRHFLPMLPAYMLVVNFGLVRIAPENGPLEIAPGTHRMPRKEALRAVEAAEIEMQPVPLEIGDVLIRHPWALHRGTPSTTDTPRALVSIRYVRRWYADSTRASRSGDSQRAWRYSCPSAMTGSKRMGRRAGITQPSVELPTCRLVP